MMRGSVAAALVVLFWTAWVAPAQVPAPPSGGQLVMMSPSDLDQLLKPIALYPDPLLAVLLPAATLPAEIVLADRFMSQGNQPSQIDSQPWDPCIKAIAHYPELLKWLDDNLNWTTEVGQAFINQQQDVTDSIQRLRGQAQVLGNLTDSPQETVVNEDGDIDIEPTQPDQIYLPVYDPNAIYDQAGIYCSFGVGWPIGGWLINDWDWRNGRILTWGAGHPRPGGWWHRTPQQRIGLIARGGGAVWRPTGRGYGYVAASRAADRGWASVDMRGGRLAEPGRPAAAFARPLARPATPPPAARGFESRPAEAGARGFEARPEGGARGFESRPEAGFSRPAETRAPVESRPAFESRGSSGVGVFGGPQNSGEARESSARGMESRGGGGGGASAGGGGRRR